MPSFSRHGRRQHFSLKGHLSEGEVSDAGEEFICKPVFEDLPVWFPEQAVQAPLAWRFCVAIVPSNSVDLERECFGTSSWRLVEIDVGLVSKNSSFG